MCRAILANDNRFSEVEPRHPRGGPDGGRDLQAFFRENQKAFGAVGFVNQANDSNKQKRKIENKFSNDLQSAIDAKDDLSVFVFFTNINLTIGEKDDLIEEAKDEGILHCEIFDRERIRIELDSSDGFSIRFQYLNIVLSEEEQASFFSKWGADIQSVISSGFQKMERTMNRLLFLQESSNPISHLIFKIELDKKYEAEEIGHFRFFCDLILKEPKHNIFTLFFGSADKSNRLSEKNATKQKPGIKYGISSGQWEQHFDLNEDENNKEDFDEKDIKWHQVRAGSSIGKEEVEFISIDYRKGSFIRYIPVISLKDLDEAMYILLANKSLANKVKVIHVYSNGYKLQEIHQSDINIDTSEVDLKLPIEFDKKELEDQWVRIRPEKESTFHLRFFENTPKRMFTSNQVESSLPNNKD